MLALASFTVGNPYFFISMFRFLFSHLTFCSVDEAALKKKATWKQSSNPLVCSFAYIHCSYTLILHVYTKIL